MIMTTQAWMLLPLSLSVSTSLRPSASLATTFWSCSRQNRILRQQQSASSSFFKLASSLNDDDDDDEMINEKEISGPRPDAADDDDCEDECDIDWDAMPGWDDDDAEKEVETQQQPVAAAVAAAAAAAAITAVEPEPEPSPETLRLRLEMAWQQDEAAEDCDIEQPVTCGSEPCQTCRGRGWSDCRFCHGTMLLRNSHARISMGDACSTREGQLSSTTTTTATTARTRTKWSLPCDTFTPCRICHQGVETCTTCKGSGWVAGWTQLSNQQPPQQGDDADDDDDSSRRHRLFP